MDKRGDINELKSTGVLKGRDAAGRRKIKLRKADRKELRQQALVEAAVALFLDLESDHSWQEIADELGISIQTLKDITRSEEFDEIYNQHFSELGHDPRLKATQAALSDLLPAAVRQLRSLITDPGISASVRLNAIKEIFRLGGVSEPTQKKNNLQEVLEFLQAQNIAPNVTIVKPPEIPDEYKEIYALPETVEGEVQEETREEGSS